MYFITCALLLVCVAVGAFILSSRLGKVLVAIRDREDRVRFSGYDPALFKAFIFAVAALFSAVGGAMFTLQVGPGFAVAGRHRALHRDGHLCGRGRTAFADRRGLRRPAGRVGKTFFSENFVEYWLYFIGGLFVIRGDVPARRTCGLSLDQARERRHLGATGAGAREAMSELILAVEDLTVSFDGFKAVDGLNFYVEQDELRCVIGPNGAGKTTLLDMICGKTKPTTGSIKFKHLRSRST